MIRQRMSVPRLTRSIVDVDGIPIGILTMMLGASVTHNSSIRSFLCLSDVMCTSFVSL